MKFKTRPEVIGKSPLFRDMRAINPSVVKDKGLKWKTHTTGVCDVQSSAMDGYMLFRRDRQGRRASGVPCRLGSVLIVYYCSDGDDRTESLCGRIGGRLTRQMRWWESVINYQVKRQVKYSVSGELMFHDC